MSSRTLRPKRRSWSGMATSIDLFDKLPSWAKVTVYVLGVVGFFYCVARYGLGSTLLHVIFSPSYKLAFLESREEQNRITSG